MKKWVQSLNNKDRESFLEFCKKKKSSTEKTDQFLAGLGTAGGAIGSPSLVGFGGTDIQEWDKVHL